MRVLLLLLAFMAGGCGCASMPEYAVSKPSAFKVVFPDGTCSAAAVGKTTILIATHCLNTEPQTVGGRAVKVLERTDDGRDHSLLRLNIAFDQWASFGAKPEQGQDIYYYGNPLGLDDLFRKGYVSGFAEGKILVDAEGGPGDSGSAVFDAQGRVIGVISVTVQSPFTQFRMMGMFPLAFTREQLRQAQS